MTAGGEGAPGTNEAGAPHARVPDAATPRRRRPRRAVLPGTGDPEPSVDLRSVDDTDVGWQAPADGSDDARLRREVPPHW